MNSNSVPLNLPASVVAQIALAIADAIARGLDPKVAEQAILARLTLNSR